jgi:hypothetical protein
VRHLFQGIVGNYAAHTFRIVMILLDSNNEPHVHIYNSDPFIHCDALAGLVTELGATDSVVLVFKIELQQLSPSRRRSLLSNRDALRTMFQELMTMRDFHLNKYLITDHSSPDVWYQSACEEEDEPAKWRQQICPDLKQPVYTNLDTGEKVDHLGLLNKMKQGVIYHEDVLWLSKRDTMEGFKQAFMYENFKFYEYTRALRHYHHPWKRRLPWTRNIFNAHSYQQSKRDPVYSFLTHMLTELNFGTFDWYLGCILDQVICQMEEMFKEGRPHLLGPGCVITHNEFWDLAFESSFSMLSSEEQQKNDLQHYKLQYGPFLYK